MGPTLPKSWLARAIAWWFTTTSAAAIASAVRWGPFEEGDLLDQDRLRRVLAEHRFEAVLHFAAFAVGGRIHAIAGDILP